MASIASVMGALRMLESAASTAMVSDRAALILLDAARRNHPVKTGATADKLRVKTTMTPALLRLELRGSIISQYLITGTRPHTITAKNARALRWEDQGGGVHFARTVHHPGTKPRDFRSKVVYSARPAIMALGLQWSKYTVENLKKEMG